MKRTKGTLSKGIDKSTLRKNIERNMHVKPGGDTVDFILQNYYLSSIELETNDNINEIKNSLREYDPILNITGRKK